MQSQWNHFETDGTTERVLAYYGHGRFRYPIVGLSHPQVVLTSWRLRVVLQTCGRRLFDCGLALASMLFALPIMLLAVIAIKLDSQGPAIYSQTRVGKRGKPFTLYKFRSMSVDAEARQDALLEHNEVNGPVFKMQRDPRITRVGRIIRKTSIDELPQLFNVLKGDMSLVGPRPPLPGEVDYYSIDQLRRLEARPGLTGLAQIMGRSDLDFDQWVELDRHYIAHRTLRGDLTILLKTIPVVVLGRGAY